MPAPDQESVVKAMADFIAFGREVGVAKFVQPLEHYEAEFRVAKPAFKVLRGTVRPLMDRAFLAMRNRLCDGWHEPRPGKKKQVERMHQTFRALDDLIYPPDLSETEIAGLAGNEESTTVLGDTAAAGTIAKFSLEAVRKFSQAIFKGDVETAYELCAIEFRRGKNLKQFTEELRKADSSYGGPAVDLRIERITWIYADEASRQRPNSKGDWPKDTPKSNKRSLVGTFWFTDRKTRQGRWVFFWVTEESEGYRVAKFNQYLQ
jgi:hypothetical protein